MFVVIQWKQVDGYPYEVSDTGLVRSSRKVLKARPNNRGHLRVTLRQGGQSKDVLVSRLVATAFLPNPERLPFVRHKDFNRSNNAATNLEWCSHHESIERAVEGGRFDALVSPSRAKRLNESLAEKIYAMRASGKTFSAIARSLNVTAEAAMNVCHGVAWRHEARPSLSRRR